jgi:hypothetical protein
MESDKYRDFDIYALPSNSNELSRYFRKNINIKLLDAIKFQDTIENNKRIILEFKINKKFKVNNLRVNSQYNELNNEIKEAFKNYDIKKLNLPKESELYTYKIQIISSYNNRSIINCSTHIIYDKLPVYEGCVSKTTHSNLSTCNYEKLKAHVLNNIDAKVIEESKILGELMLFPKFTVDVQGDITHIESKAPNDVLILELNRVISLLSKVKPATRNGRPILYNTNSAISLVIEPKTETYKSEVMERKDTLLNENSDLSLHLKKYIKKDELKAIKLMARQKYVTISFGIDKKGKYIDIKNNIKDDVFSEKVNKIFQNYPIEKHAINEVDLLATYSYIIITKGYEDLIIQTENKPIVRVPPIFKGCENEESSMELKKCTSSNIAYLVKKEFNEDLQYKTNLKGDIKIYCIFKIDTTGNIVDVKVRAPNPYLTNEIETIIKNMPPAIKPGTRNGKPVTVPYSFPLVYKVGQNKPEDPFKRSPVKKY